MTPTNPLSLLSPLLTLAGLVGSFFYIQLSQWLRDLVALHQKVELNRFAGDEPQKRAIIECRIEYRRLATWHIYAVNLSVIAFVLFILVLGLLMIRPAAADPMYDYLAIALWVFLAVFVGLASVLFWLGHSKAREIGAILEPKRPSGG
ncbi:hypothetical protein [Inquilinus limosus]|uniref:DUF2721 domain-containing protein n=1 Tax=Inquilinus limosus MP06 TaxID=1398085 RepID=A0A0A0CX63_9PROT|nr:hypothetical protein [Inquilinus limosus]KGM30354.1 hypothetical protein P409_33555 [Inquilinus limosus MP06]